MKRAHGSFGSRNGAAWSQQWATDRKRGEDAASSHSTASTQEAVVPPSPEALKRSIEANDCPFCGSGPYRNLGLHTNKAHGISAGELREMSGLDVVCSAELSTGSRERLDARPDRDELAHKGGAAAKAAGATERAHAASMQARSILKAHAASIALGIERSEQRDPIIASRAAAGHRLKDIASDLGITVMTVQRTLKRLGVKPTLEQANADRRARLSEHRAVARAATERRLEVERDRRLARFAELGGGWSALILLADELKVSRKSMRAFLVKHGVNIDGRRS